MQTTKIKQLKRELKNKRAITACAKEFGVVGDQTRLKICYLLCHHKELSVGEISEITGVSISAVSRTLKKLHNAKIVNKRRDFKTVYYKLNSSPFVEILKDRLTHAKI